MNTSSKTPFLIGVAGGTASGKSSVCHRIIERLGKEDKHRVTTISQDSFYKELTEKESKRAENGDFNFDHPGAFDHDYMLSVLHKLLNGESVKVHNYDFRLNSKSDETTLIKPADVIIVEGILIFYEQELRDLFDMKLFVDTDSDDRLSRRVQRDISERGRLLNQVIHQYLTLVKPAFEDFCLPTKKYADIIIPRGADNNVAIDLILHHINGILNSEPSSTIKNLETGLNYSSNSFSRFH